MKKDLKTILITKQIYAFVKQYTQMEINGKKVHCPYWMNKITAERKIIRGFQDGKGKAEDIKNEIAKLLVQTNKVTPPQLLIRKLSKSKRIGIDCSGFVYRVLEELVRLKYQGTNLNSLEDLFTGGVTRTNADRLTSYEFSVPIKKVAQIRLGDMIRLQKGRHIALILEVKKKEIIYCHASQQSTKIKGAHLSKIIIKNPVPTLKIFRRFKTIP